MGRLSIDPANMAPFLVTSRATTQMRRVQSANPSVDRPSTQERELGNHQIVGTTFETPNVGLAVEAHLVNHRILAEVLNRDPAATTFTNYSILDGLGVTDVDLMLVQRNTTRTAWLSAVYFRQCGIASYRISASVNGPSTETLQLQTNNKTGFERFITTDHLVATGIGQTAWTLTSAPAALTRGALAGKSAISVVKAQVNGAGTYLLEGAGLDFTISGTTLTLTAGAAADVIVGTQLLVSYQKSSIPAGDPYQAVDSTSPAAIRGYYHVPVTLTVSATDLSVRGVQSAEMTADFGIQQEVGMGLQTIGFFRQTPPNLSGNFVVFAENRDVMRFLTDGNLTSSDTDYPIEAYRDDIELKLQFKDPSTGTVLRTDRIINLTISGETGDIAVGQAIGKQYNLVGAEGADWLISN